MNLRNSIKKTAAVLSVVVPVLVASLSGSANAMVPYNPGGTSTTKTPVFNQFYNVPDGVGNEADFVRVKPQAGTNADYVSDLNSACNNNDAYTVRTYVHNGADPSQNNNGSGSAVAHNTVVKMTAPVGSTANNFTFASTISASNAASVTDTGRLICAKTVKLELVSGSVKVYSKFTGWQSAPDSAVNGTLPIGSRTAGSGDVWACWDDRVIVTYDVKVVTPPTPPISIGECKVADLKLLGGRKIEVSVTGTTQNAQIVGYEIDWGDGSKSNKQTDQHEYAKDGTYTIVTRVQVKYADGRTEWKTSAACKREITFKPGQPPVVPPVTPPTTVTTATPVLPNTGPGEVVAIFSAVSIAGAMAYRVFMTRRLSH